MLNLQKKYEKLIISESQLNLSGVISDDDNDLEDLLSDIESLNRETTSLSSNQSFDDELEKLLELGFDFSVY